MRILERNKRTFYYCPYKETKPITDEYGNKTGERKVIYGEAVKMCASISSASGKAQIEQFGTLSGYDKVIITDDMACPIDENTVLFIGKDPEYRDGSPLYNYQVTRVSRSNNYIAYAVSEVNVS